MNQYKDDRDGPCTSQPVAPASDLRFLSPLPVGGETMSRGTQCGGASLLGSIRAPASALPGRALPLFWRQSFLQAQGPPAPHVSPAVQICSEQRLMCCPCTRLCDGTRRRAVWPIQRQLHFIRARSGRATSWSLDPSTVKERGGSPTRRAPSLLPTKGSIGSSSYWTLNRSLLYKES